MNDWVLVGVAVGVMLAAVVLAAVMLWPEKKLVTTSQGDVVVKSDVDFEVAVAKGVDKRMEEIEALKARTAEEKAERDAARKARKKFSEPWVCPKCGSSDSAVKWTGEHTVQYSYTNPQIYGYSFNTIPRVSYAAHVADADVLDVKCERCGYSDQFNPLDAK